MLAIAALAAAAVGQTPAALDFRTGDGSRVLLLPTAGPPLVHWAMATPCGAQIDPLAAPGLAAACATASMRGTWSTGSFDADRERSVRQQLDTAETDLLVAPRSGGEVPAALAEAVRRLRGEAAALCDEQAFLRVLRATPAQDVELRVDSDVAVLSLTTTPFAVAAIARLLRERREQPALRSVRADFRQLRERATAAWDRAPLSSLYAEALALAFPGHPLARAGDRPTAAGFHRELAVATWGKAQHPSNTVHVLTGNFDPRAVQQALQQVFTDTALLAPEPLVVAAPRAQPALRRSLVPGAGYPAAVLAFTLRADADPIAIATVARWFAGGADSWLAREFARRGRKTVLVDVRAPWPASAGPGLMVVEVADPSGGAPGLADEALALCSKDVPKSARPGELQQSFGSVLRDFERATRSEDLRAGWFATRLLERPDQPVPPPPPATPPFQDLPALLQQILDGNPIVVERRNA